MDLGAWRNKSLKYSPAQAQTMPKKTIFNEASGSNHAVSGVVEEDWAISSFIGYDSL
jgi:hypothetical protein